MDAKNYTFENEGSQGEAANCRVLWLQVIRLAVEDSRSDKAENKSDLAEVIASEWWQDIFYMAGLSDAARHQLTATIRKNLSR